MPVVIGLVSQKGGTGKSTLARALGAVVAGGSYKVTIADLDPSQDTVIEWDKLRDKNRLGPHINVQDFKTPALAIARADGDELLIVDMPSGTSRNLLDLAERADLLVQPTSGICERPSCSSMISFGPASARCRPASCVQHRTQIRSRGADCASVVKLLPGRPWHLTSGTQAKARR